MARLNARGLQSKLRITPLSDLSQNIDYTACMVQPRISTCTMGLATAVSSEMGNLAWDFQAIYSCLVYIHDTMHYAILLLGSLLN